VKRVLFICVENAGRSQMAEAFADNYGKDKPIEKARDIRDDIERRVQKLIIDKRWW
jgi:protein-tyrosine-phosphatase